MKYFIPVNLILWTLLLATSLYNIASKEPEKKIEVCTGLK